jgi:peptidoglycan/xylan/chitin deacetylase (PgdA/CDA1 family)
MLRSIGKTCFAAVYTLTYGAYGRAKRSVPRVTSPFIICYHRVVENFGRSAESAIPSMLISTSMLERHIEWLAKRFKIVSLDDIGTYLESDGPSHRPVAAITFDDGYADVYHNGLPLLKRKGVPAAVFVVTDLVGTGRPQVFDRLYLLLKVLQARGLPVARTVEGAMRSVDLVTEDTKFLQNAQDEPFRIMTLLLKRLSYHRVGLLMTALEQSSFIDHATLEECAPLTWDMIETMHQGGVIIGSHTKSHTLLTSESPEMAMEQLIESKRVLEGKLKSTVKHFAYPDGRFNSSVVQAVNSAGYRFAYGICRRKDQAFPLLTISRKVLWERACINAWGRFSPSIMSCHSGAAFDSKYRCEHDHFSQV